MNGDDVRTPTPSPARHTGVRDFLTVVFRRKGIILGLFATVSVTVGVLAFTRPVEFASFGSVLLKRGEQESVMTPDRRFTGWEEEMATEAQVVKSWAVRERAQRVIDAVSHYLAHTNSNHGGLFATSIESDALLGAAISLSHLNRHEEAIAIAREAAESHSARLSSRAALAVVLSEAGCLDEALRVAKAIVDTAPQDATAHGTLGTVYLKMKAGGSALDSFERATCLACEPAPLPSSDWIRYATGRAVALSLLGRHEEAIAGFGEVLRIDPELLERWPDFASHYQRSSREDIDIWIPRRPSTRDICVRSPDRRPRNAEKASGQAGGPTAS